MKHPDFNEWINTKDGKGCNNMDTLTGQPFLKNRLFWAFDAGRNCVWDQYIKQKSELSAANEEITKLHNAIATMTKTIKTE